LSTLIEFVGKISLFGIRVIIDGLRPPIEAAQILRQIAEVGSKSLPLVIAAGFALGTVMTLHTRSTLVTFGAGAMIPTVQALAFFVEVGPLVAGLLIAGRVGSGIGAVLANMRATEQIDGIESLSIDSFKFLVVPRVVAAVVALPLLTLFMDFSGLSGGFLSEFASSKISFALYIRRAFENIQWANFIAPTVKTGVFAMNIVRHDEYGCSMLGFLPQQQLVNLGCGDPVEAATRLVRQKNSRFEHERPRQARPLSHST
jgi:phospholipid/cholesterol/gamma-HCH transport system permease protein